MAASLGRMALASPIAAAGARYVPFIFSYPPTSWPGSSRSAGHPSGGRCREFARRIGYVTEMTSQGSNPQGSIAAPILEAARVTLPFGGVKALTDVSFSIRERELFSIIGPNGAGKTSIVNCISGRYRPTVGK